MTKLPKSTSTLDEVGDLARHLAGHDERRLRDAEETVTQFTSKMSDLFSEVQIKQRSDTCEVTALEQHSNGVGEVFQTFAHGFTHPFGAGFQRGTHRSLQRDHLTFRSIEKAAEVGDAADLGGISQAFARTEAVNYGFAYSFTASGVEITYRQGIPGVVAWLYLIVGSLIPFLQIFFIPILLIYFVTNFLMRLFPKKISVSDGVIVANGHRLSLNSVQNIYRANPVLKRVGVTGERGIVWHLFTKHAAQTNWHIMADYGVAKYRIAKHLSDKRADIMQGLLVATLRELGW